MSLIKVTANSRPVAVAGSISGTMRDCHHAEVRAIGAAAVNQAVKAVAIARGYLAGDGIDLICIPELVNLGLVKQ